MTDFILFGTECFITIRVFITKQVVTVYPNCNNVLPAGFVINY